MKSLFSNVRFYILLFSFLLGIVLFLYVLGTFSSERLQIIRLTQFYALTALAFLYFTLLVGPINRFIHNSFIEKWLKARRALGVSAFVFGLLHGSIAFFGQLGGFEGLYFLNNRYLFALSLSSFSLFILLLLALTSFDWIIAKMKFKRWKALHRLVYFAGIGILVHAVMLGTHFQVLSSTIPFILFIGLAILLLLHALLLDRQLEKGRFFLFRFGATSFLTLLFLGFIFIQYVNPFVKEGSNQASSSFSIHTQHIQLAEQAQQPGGLLNANAPSGRTIPGLSGDPTKRYSVTFKKDPVITAGKATTLGFSITDASNGNPVLLYDTIYEKQMHLILVNEELSYFNHIHPEFSAEGFTIETIFPKDGFYRLYIDFQPKGAIEQQFAFLVKVGNADTTDLSNRTFTESFSSFVDDYSVRLDTKTSFQSSLLSVGKQLLTFTISDKNGNPFNNLYPYLSSFGHLVLINEETKDYIHVHPANLTPPKPEDRSGPEIQFLPLGLYGPIKPGNYRVFLQLNPDGELKTFEFSIRVKP